MSALQTRRVAITGASRGLGRRMAQDLVAAGARVALLARASDDLDAAAADLGERALAVPADVGSLPSMEAAMARAAEALGGLDAVVNNAALYHPLKIDVSPAELIERHVTTNVRGAIWGVRAALPHLRAAGGGDIVNVSSVAVRNPRKFLGIYGATKAALETFSHGLRTELKGEPIRVSILRIGSMAGGTGGGGWDPDIRSEFVAAIQASGGPTGVPMSTAALSQILLNLLSLPRDVNIDLVDARPI
jgi:meso-butanediol dehydrogenase/(S,S)-butanediol dehydrogenase/diacetyl reductase